MNYIGILNGASAFLDNNLAKVGVEDTPPGKWKTVANSSVFNTKGA